MTAGEGRNKALTKLRNRVSSVFIRYALSYMAVVLVLFASIMAYLYVQSAQQAREGIIDNQINRLTRIASQHEGYISAMLNTAEEIGLSPHIEPFSYDQEPWRAYDLQLQLVPYTSTNTFCDQVYLYFSGEDRLYSSSSSMTVDLFTRMMRYERVTPEALRALITGADRMVILPSQRVSPTLVDGGDPRVITFIVPLGANPGTSKGCLLFLVKDSVYKSLFADAIDGDINTYIFQQNDVLASSEDLPVPADQAALPPENGAPVLVAGLGNRTVTPDALGPLTVDHTLVTRHLYAERPELTTRGMASVCAVAPGVLGVTGVETSEMVRAVAQAVKPRAVIAIDSLSARAVSRVAATVQLTDTGIQPGSGVGNHRAALTAETLGVPVIAVGVPMVIYAAAIARDAFDMLSGGEETPEREEALDAMTRELLDSALGEMIVTPREVDDLVRNAAAMVAGGLNRALHPGLSEKDIMTMMQ